jgi:hypothetical protein
MLLDHYEKYIKNRVVRVNVTQTCCESHPKLKSSHDFDSETNYIKLF